METITNDKNNIGVITPIAPKAGMLSNLVKVTESIFNEVYLVAANVNPEDYTKAHVYPINHNSETNIFSFVASHILLHINLTCQLVKLRKKADIWIFFLGGEVLLLPMLVSKLLNKKVVLLIGGNSLKEIEMNRSPLLLFVRFLRESTLLISNKIIIYSENLIAEWGLEKHEKKISICHEHFLDFSNYKIQNKHGNRGNIIGFIGRMSTEKGALNFTKAIPNILEKKPDFKFLFVGDGQLKDEITTFLDENKLIDEVSLVGWVSQGSIPCYLNKLKLLIIPSYSEGLPNLILESMACGTPVLATSVGSIPSIVKDGETGFILENNSSNCIANSAINSLEHPDMDRIIDNARLLVENEFTYDVTVAHWKEILRIL